MITIPIEAGFAGLAEAELNRYRNQIQDEQLVTFYEGRILFLQKRYGDAVEKMASIVEAQRWEIGGARNLASEALKWIRQIQNDEMINLQLQKAATGASASDDDSRREDSAAKPNRNQPGQDESPGEVKKEPSTGAASSGI